MINYKEIKNVLVLAPDKHLGDLVLALSAIDALNRHFKEKKLYLVIDSAYTDIIETIEGLENPILYPRNLLNTGSAIKRTAIMFDFLRKLRGSCPDIAIDLQGGVASSTMTFLSGAPLRVGRSSAKRSYLYNRKVNISKGRHKSYSYSNIASAVGVKGKIELLGINASERNRAALNNILFKEGITGKKQIICIHPGAGVIYKQWTEEGFADLSDRLVSCGFQVIFVGGKGDIGGIKKIMGRMKQPSFNFGGILSLGELIAIFEAASLYIGNDSGPMHLAGASGIPVIALFGPASDRWRPLSDKTTVLRGTEPCQKCKGRDCQYGFRCIREISPDDVEKAAKKVIRVPDKV